LQEIEEFKKEIGIIKIQLEELSKLHTKNPGVVSKMEDEKIDLTTKGIIEKIKVIQSSVSAIGHGKKLSSRETTLRNSIQSHLANQIQSLSTYLNRTQKHHLNQVSKQNKRLGEFIKGEESDSEDGSSWMYKGLKDSRIPQMAQLDPDTEQINERNKEMVKINQQMQEISRIFNDLAVLVVEQGSILDRIDENIMQSTVNIDHGVQALKKSNSSETNYRKRLLAILAVIFIASIIIIIIISAGKG